MNAPKRIQRKRTKGWRMPEGAVYVGRPTLFGNPWTPQEAPVATGRTAWAVERYRREMDTLGLLSDFEMLAGNKRWAEMWALKEEHGLDTMADFARLLLAGRDLVCWCPLDAPCHADVLLEIANAAPPSSLLGDDQKENPHR